MNNNFETYNEFYMDNNAFFPMLEILAFSEDEYVDEDSF
jgi:hypothetical protein